MSITIACRCRLDDGSAAQTVRLDVHLNGVPEVWLSVTEEAGARQPRGSAVWRLGRWTILAGEGDFTPHATVARALQARPWPVEPPTDRHDEVMGILRSVAAAA